MAKVYTVGVIGAGRMGKIHIENILRKVPDLKLKLVADINIDDQMEQWANTIGVPLLTQDVNDIFDDDEIDAVVIASSTDTHVKFIQKAAHMKKDIFCD